MDKKEMIQIAKIAIEKKMDYETLMYSDYMYGKESLMDNVWKYVIEAEEQGMEWFMKTYTEYLN